MYIIGIYWRQAQALAGLNKGHEGRANPGKPGFE